MPRVVRQRLHRLGRAGAGGRLLVYGFGVRRTMPAFVAACDEFVFVDAVESTDKGMRDEAGRDLAAELLESVRQMKAQQTHGVASRADQLQEKP